jgi:THO complex subunit 2
VELVALLQYVANQLQATESLDLVVLQEVVVAMTGVRAVFDVSDSQLDALAGSDTLRAAVVTQAEGGPERDVQRSMARLLRALRTGPPAQHLAAPLLVLLAQQRKLITLQPQSTHLKLVAELYDKCHEATLQYAEFLRQALPTAEYAALLPSIQVRFCGPPEGWCAAGPLCALKTRRPLAPPPRPPPPAPRAHTLLSSSPQDLAHEFRVDPEIIFELHRPLIRGIHPPAAAVADEGAAGAGGGEGAAPAAEEDDEEGEIAAGSGGGGGGGPPPGVDDGPEAMDVEEGEVAAETRAAGAGALGAAAPPPHAGGGPAWEALAAQAATLAPKGGFEGISGSLFVTFWALALYDLHVPTAAYEAALAQLRSAARSAREDIDAARREGQRAFNAPGGGGAGGYGGGGRGGGGGGGGAAANNPPPPPADVEQLTRELERAEAAIARLPVELKAQQANAKAVSARLVATRGAWCAPAAAPQSRDCSFASQPADA